MANIVAKQRDPANVPTPPTGYTTFFINATDDFPYLKYSDGTIAILGGAPSTRNIFAGDGLVGGGNLNSDITLRVLSNGDGSVLVASSGLGIGVLASDAQHGSRGGGSLHAVATVGAAGFMSAADKVILNGLSAGSVPSTRTLTAGAGLTGGGDLSANRTFDVVANADGSIIANANDIQVGVLATDAQHGSRGGGNLHLLAIAGGIAGFMSGTDKTNLNNLVTNAVLSTRTLTAGAGLTGGGDLSADRTFDVVANADGSIVANANDIQVGILATDAQHGSRGGSALHAVVVAGGANGFMSGTDKTSLNNLVTNAVLNTRTLTAGSGLTGGGDLSANRTFDVIANADGSIISNANDIQVGILATDAQHGTRGGGTLHAAATTSTAGFIAATDKLWINNYRLSRINIMDVGGDPTGVADNVAAINAAIALLPSGGEVFFPPGTYKIASTVTVATAGIAFIGADRNGSNIQTNSATADMFLINQWFVRFENLTLSTSVTRSAGFAINSPSAGGYAYTVVRHCEINGNSSVFTHFNCIQMGAILMDIDDIECRFFSNIAVVVNGQSDHRINRMVCDNAVQAVAGIQVQVTASLMISNSNIIHSGNALDITPATGITLPSIECVNTFFDTSTNGIRFNPAGTGVVYRCKFTNVWCSSHTGAGVLFAAAGGGIDGITWVNCDFYGNANGILCTAAPSKWSVQGSRFAGNTTAAINLIAGATHWPQIIGNAIGPQAAFGVNATGIIVGAGAYKGLEIRGNEVLNNTTNLTLGAVTVGAGEAAAYAITDNPGINPRGAVTAPTLSASTVATVNTTGFRCMVYDKTIGTTTVWSVNGTTTGLVAGTAGACIGLIDPGGTITITYTVAPTLAWIGM